MKSTHESTNQPAIEICHETQQQIVTAQEETEAEYKATGEDAHQEKTHHPASKKDDDDHKNDEDRDHDDDEEDDTDVVDINIDIGKDKDSENNDPSSSANPVDTTSPSSSFTFWSLFPSHLFSRRSYLPLATEEPHNVDGAAAASHLEMEMAVFNQPTSSTHQTTVDSSAVPHITTTPNHPMSRVLSAGVSRSTARASAKHKRQRKLKQQRRLAQETQQQLQQSAPLPNQRSSYAQRHPRASFREETFDEEDDRIMNAEAQRRDRLRAQEEAKEEEERQADASSSGHPYLSLFPFVASFLCPCMPYFRTFYAKLIFCIAFIAIFCFLLYFAADPYDPNIPFDIQDQITWEQRNNLHSKETTHTPHANSFNPTQTHPPSYAHDEEEALGPTDSQRQSSHVIEEDILAN